MTIPDLRPAFQWVVSNWKEVTGIPVTAYSLYRWSLYRWDRQVFTVFEQAERAAKREHPGRNIALQPVSLREIALAAERSESSVIRSLRRLERWGLVREDRDGWIRIRRHP